MKDGLAGEGGTRVCACCNAQLQGHSEGEGDVPSPGRNVEAQSISKNRMFNSGIFV